MSSQGTGPLPPGHAAAGHHQDPGVPADHGVWVYAVAGGIPPRRLAGLTGVGGHPVRVVAAAGLAAAVSTVSLAEFGEAALRRNLENLAWLEAVARVHHDVIEAVAGRGPVVPMRLATVYRGDERVAAMLAHRQDDVTAALTRVAGRTEWGVKVFAARPSAAGTAPAAAGSAPGAAAGQRPGAAFLRQRRAHLAASQNAAQAAVATAERIHLALGRRSAASMLRPPQDPQLTGRPERMILNAAYLVDDAASDGFAAEAADLASQHPQVRVELTGPWPGYSFAVPDEDHRAPGEPGGAAARGGSAPADPAGQPLPGREAAR